MDARQVIIEPVISEKSYALMAEGKYTFRVNDRAHKTQIRHAVEEIFDVEVVDGPHLPGPLEAEAPWRPLRQDPRLEEGDRRARAGQPDRALRGRSRREDRDADPQDKADQPGPPLRDLPGPLRGHDLEAEQEADQGQEEHRWPQRQRPRHRAPSRRRRQAQVPPDRLQADQGRRPRQGRDDRVRPEPDHLHRPAPLRRRREVPTSSPRPASRSATRSPPGPAPTSAPATRSTLGQIPTGTVVHNVELKPGQGGRMGRAAGTAIQVVAKEGDDGHAAPAVLGDADGPRPSAARRSAPSPTPSTRTSPSARPAAAVTRASARRAAASR